MLVPGNLRWEYVATMAGKLHISLNSPRTQFRSLAPCITRVSELFERAQQQDRDYIVALCGYRLASISYCYGGFGCADGDGSHPPSASLGWLQQAEQAYARCRAVLPKQWVAELKGSQESALARKPLLERLQRQGDRLAAPNCQRGQASRSPAFQGHCEAGRTARSGQAVQQLPCDTTMCSALRRMQGGALLQVRFDCKPHLFC